jgi:hypothetical protein
LRGSALCELARTDRHRFPLAHVHELISVLKPGSHTHDFAVVPPATTRFINSVLTHAATCACAPSLPGLLRKMRACETPAEKPSVTHLVALTDRLTRFDHSRFERTVFGRLERAFSG